VIQKLKLGADFAEMARDASVDNVSRRKGGEIPPLGRGSVLGDAAFKLKPGQFTDVIAEYDQGHRIVGYAIYRLLAREPAGQRELNDPRVQQAIHQTLHDSQKQLLQNAYLETLQDNARVRNFFAEEILKRGGQ